MHSCFILDASARYQRPSLSLDLSPGIHTLLGPRRIGKTTQFKLWCIEALKQFNPQNVAYWDAERHEFWKELLPGLESLQENQIKVLFIDEVTAVKDWERALKVATDSGALEGICIWITGSNAFDLKSSGERLPGRRGQNLKIRDIELLPLTFSEFFSATRFFFPYKTPHELFVHFCQWGGYPMAISEFLTRKEPSIDLLKELLDVVLGQTSKHHRSPRLSAALAERLWQRLGDKSSYHALSKFIDAGSHPVIRQYIEILQSCYLLIEVERFNSKTKLGILRKEKKYYFLDPLVMSAIVCFSQTGDVDPEWVQRHWQSETAQGHWVENMVASELTKRGLKLYYDEQFGGEIDFVFKEKGKEHMNAVEVKRSLPSPTELKPLQAYRGSEAWVLFCPDSVKPPIFSLIDRLLNYSSKND